MRPSSPAGPRRRRWFARALLALSVALAALLALELTGRWLVPGAAPPPPGLLADEALGWTLPRAAVYRWSGHDVTTNRLALRGHDPLDDPGRPVVLALGDSSVFGHGVGDEDTFPAQLEVVLAARGYGADVQNGGVPGYTCAQAKAQLERLAPVLQPRVVVLYVMHSDLRLARPGDVPFGGAGGGLRAAGIARLAAYLATRSRAARGRPGTSQRAYERCLAAMVDRQLRAGGWVYLAPPPGAWDVAPPGPGDKPAPQGVDARDVPRDDKGEFEDPSLRYRAAMATLADERGAVLVDLPAAFRDSGLALDVLFLDAVHPTPTGHTLIAETLADAMLAAGP